MKHQASNVMIGSALDKAFLECIPLRSKHVIITKFGVANITRNMSKMKICLVQAVGRV